MVFHILIVAFAIYLGSYSAPVGNATAECPAGYPLKNESGELVRCNCPPGGFCPANYFCKTDVQGQPGICCSDTEVHETENTPTPANYESSIGTDNETSTTEVEGKTYAETTTKAATVLTLVSESESTSVPFNVTVPQYANNTEPPQAINSTEAQGTTELLISAAVNKDCPTVTIPPLVDPLCRLGEPKMNNKGCLLEQEVICLPTSSIAIKQILEQENSSTISTTAAIPSTTPTMVGNISAQIELGAGSYAVPASCPKYQTPTFPEDCYLEQAVLDANGCPAALELKCLLGEGTSNKSYITLNTNSSLPPISVGSYSFNETTTRSSQNSTTNAVLQILTANSTIECKAVNSSDFEPLPNSTCSYKEQEPDANGCPSPPKVVCLRVVKNCKPVYYPNLQENCTFGPDRINRKGCPRHGHVICGGVITEFHHRIMTNSTPENCTDIKPPVINTWCRLGETKMDSHGCPLEPEVICAEDLVTTTPGPPSFKGMLTPEYFVRNNSDENPDPAKFHKAFGAPFNSSGKFHICESHANCFNYREPREWCQGDSNSVWICFRNKSCYCSQDTIIPSCILERMVNNTHQWTFCADFSQCAVG